MFRFPYRPVAIYGPTRHSLPPGTTYRFRPLIPDLLRNPATGWFCDFPLCVADSGADDTVFPVSAATQIGLTFLPTPGITTGVRWRGASHISRFAHVELVLDDKVQSCRWSA